MVTITRHIVVNLLIKIICMTKAFTFTGRTILHALITLVAIAFIGVFVVIPLAAVFVEAFAAGASGYFGALASEDSRAAIKLTLLVSAIAVPCNVVFGLAASWAITKFDFFGKRLLVTLIDLPFSVSPVISGLVFVLLFGADSIFSSFLD